MKPFACLAVPALVLAACASPEGLSTHGAAAEPAAVHVERALANVAEGAPLATPWWSRYGDPRLDALVAEAIAGNPSVQVVRARVEQARAAAASAHLGLTPTTRGSASASRQRLSEHGLVPPPFGGAWIWQNQAMLDFDYELDFWGRNRKAYEAALGKLRAAEMDAAAARLLLEAAVTRAYLQLDAAHAQADLAQAAIVQRSRILEITRARVEAGLDSRMELRQAEGAVPQAREQRLAAEQALALARDQIAALLGQGADRGLGIARPALHVPPLALPSRLPADLVGRRADVAAQRERVEAALRGIESARAAFYPNIDLTAFVGLQALDFSNFLRPGSLTAGVGPALRLPFFERGRLRAALQARQADWDLEVAQYNETVVAALREVVDEASAVRLLEQRQVQARAALEAAEQSHALALERYRAGTGNYLQVLAAESQVLAQRALDADLRARRLDADVALIRALGGGYDPAALASAPH